MNKRQLLIDREFQVEGNWYAPLEKLQSYSSVVWAELLDTCSSAGDWSGAFVQKIGNCFYMIGFSQENNYPRGGFTLWTGNVVAYWKDDELQSSDDMQALAIDIFYGETMYVESEEA